MKINWRPLLEMDMEDGRHTCYYDEIIMSNGQKLFIYCTEGTAHCWNCEVMMQNSGIHDIRCVAKTLTSAKRWWTQHFAMIVNEYENNT